MGDFKLQARLFFHPRFQAVPPVPLRFFPVAPVPLFLDVEDEDAPDDDASAVRFFFAAAFFFASFPAASF